TPLTKENIADENRYLRFSGKNIFEKGVALWKNVILEIMQRNRISFNEVDYIVMHQANGKMIESLATSLHLPIEKFIVNIEHIGNTGAGSIPIAISEALRHGKLKGNEKLLLAS